MNRLASPVRTRDGLDELVDADAAHLASTDVDRPGPIATTIAVAGLLALGVLVGLALGGWWL